MKCGRNVYKSVQMTDGPLDMTNNQYDYNLFMFSYEKNIDIILYVAFSDAQFVLFSHNLKRTCCYPSFIRTI